MQLNGAPGVCSSRRKGINLIVVHDSQWYDPKKAVTRPIEAMAMMKGKVFDQVYEYQQHGYGEIAAPSQVSSRLDRVVLVQPVELPSYKEAEVFASLQSRFSRVIKQKAPDDFSIPGLEGETFVLVGGGFGFCHKSAFLAIVEAALKRGEERLEFHFPAPAIFTNVVKGGSGDSWLEAVPVTVDLMQKKIVSYTIDLSNVAVIKVGENQPGVEEQEVANTKIIIFLWANWNDLMRFLAKLK